MKRLARPLAMLVLLALGCGIDSMLNKLDRETEKTVDLACSCTNVYPDRAACEDMFAVYTSLFDRDCLEDALDEDRDASKESLKCALDQAKEFNRCLEDKLDCNDGTSIQGCSSVFETECPELPAAVQVKLSTCGGFN